MGKRVLTPSEGFNQFWAKYPKRFAKRDALKAWADLDPSPDLLARILTALGWQCEQAAWVKDGGQFIPYPATWIRAGRWDDEPVVSGQGIFQSHSPKTAGNAAALQRFAAK